MQVKNFLGNNGKGEIMKIKWNLKSAAALLAASSLVSPAFDARIDVHGYIELTRRTASQ